jgi:hypothetical protein
MRLTRSELLTITGHTENGFSTKQRRAQWAMAYSRRDAGARDWYCPADAVAVLLTAELAKTHGATQAAALVLMFGGAVLRAIAEAEHASTGDVLLGVADLARDVDGRRAYLACSALDVGAEGYTVERVTTINVSRLVRVVRINAERVGIGLSGALMPAPDSAEFSAILAPYSELQAVVEHSASARRKRLADVRRAGELARALAMGGRVVSTGLRKQPEVRA